MNHSDNSLKKEEEIDTKECEVSLEIEEEPEVLLDIAEEEIEETKKSQTQIDRLVGNVKKINYIIPEEKKKNIYNRDQYLSEELEKMVKTQLTKNQSILELIKLKKYHLIR